MPAAYSLELILNTVSLLREQLSPVHEHPPRERRPLRLLASQIVTVDRDSYHAILVGNHRSSAELEALDLEGASVFSSRAEGLAALSPSMAKLSRSPAAMSEVNACRHPKTKPVISHRDAGTSTGRGTIYGGR